jgi:two-component system CheB/CheR fusion protein
VNKTPEFEELLDTLAEERGLDLRGYKRTTLERRIGRRMQQLKLTGHQQYLEYIRAHDDEINQLLNCILINVTRFFRDPVAWRLLQKEVLPRLLQQRSNGISFRAWCAGCATGEEPYSLAILLAEHFGSTLLQHDIKIYANDQDEAALNFARRGEYSSEHLDGIPPAWRAKYFQDGEPGLRVHRDLRRLVIFGRSNILKDAPISHVNLLVCRNLLIYFDAASQQQILSRLEYVLDPGGVLFLGKTETQLRGNRAFAPLSAKWRLFQRVAGGRDLPQPIPEEDDLRQQIQQELWRLQTYHESVLNSIQPGILVLDIKDCVISENEPVRRMWDLKEGSLNGHPLAETELARRCPELLHKLDESRAERPQQVRFDYPRRPDHLVAITVKPIMSKEQSGQVGTLIHMEDISSQENLQGTVEELETTTEELQSANEELETTNEELQSTNEELETTNEELQSSNEELETTNEELQSLNEELETTNEELAERTRQLDQVNERYHEMIERMPWPVLLVDRDKKIYLYNSAARKILGFAPLSAEGMALNEVPIQNALSRVLVRSYAEVTKARRPLILRKRLVRTNRATQVADIHITPLSGSTMDHGVLVMFNILPDLFEDGQAKNKVKGPAAGRRNSSKRNNSRKRK